MPTTPADQPAGHIPPDQWDADRYGTFFTGAPERKVTAATGGAAAGVIVGQFACWALDVYALTPGVTGDLPRPVEALVTLLAGAAVALAAGYATRNRL